VTAKGHTQAIGNMCAAYASGIGYASDTWIEVTVAVQDGAPGAPLPAVPSGVQTTGIATEGTVTTTTSISIFDRDEGCSIASAQYLGDGLKFFLDVHEDSIEISKTPTSPEGVDLIVDICPANSTSIESCEQGAGGAGGLSGQGLCEVEIDQRCAELKSSVESNGATGSCDQVVSSCGNSRQCDPCEDPAYECADYAQPNAMSNSGCFPKCVLTVDTETVQICPGIDAWVCPVPGGYFWGKEHLPTCNQAFEGASDKDYFCCEIGTTPTP
jgi:hypothetical protein